MHTLAVVKGHVYYDREPGVGMVGAGIVRPPREAFEAALLALAAEYA